TASIGGILIPAMKREGYGAGFSVAVTASSSTVGPIIPPSLPMIIVGTLASLSIGDLFVAGIVPGILIGFGLMILTYLISVNRNWKKFYWCRLGIVINGYNFVWNSWWIFHSN